MSLKRNSLKGQAGFTLLELMVVIVILGVLASMVVPNLMGNKEKADAQKATSDIVALEGSLDMYKLDNHRYPTTEQGLQALVTKTTVMMAISAACRKIRGAMIIFWSARVNMAQWMFSLRARMPKRIPRMILPTGL